MKLLVFFGLLLLAYDASAQAQQVCPANPKPSAVTSAQLCWINAWRDVNGNLLPSTGPYAVIKTRIHRKQVGKNADCNFNDPVSQTINVTPDVLAYLLKNLPSGTKQCFRARHISKDKAGKELYSNWSPPACKITTANTPCKPTAASKTAEESWLIVQ